MGPKSKFYWKSEKVWRRNNIWHFCWIHEVSLSCVKNLRGRFFSSLGMKFFNFSLKKSAETSPTHSGEKQNSIFTKFFKIHFRMKQKQEWNEFWKTLWKLSFAFPLNGWVMFLRKNHRKGAFNAPRGVLKGEDCFFSSGVGGALFPLCFLQRFRSNSFKIAYYGKIRNV